MVLATPDRAVKDPLDRPPLTRRAPKASRESLATHLTGRFTSVPGARGPGYPASAREPLEDDEEDDPDEDDPDDDDPDEDDEPDEDESDFLAPEDSEEEEEGLEDSREPEGRLSVR